MYSWQGRRFFAAALRPVLRPIQPSIKSLKTGRTGDKKAETEPSVSRIHVVSFTAAPAFSAL